MGALAVHDPLLFSVLALPFGGMANWAVGFLTTAAIFAILALALNLQWGYTGVFNFGIAAFMMVGAYTSALLTVGKPGDYSSYILGFGWPVWAGWLGALVAGGVFALLLGLPTLRLRGDFLAIATISAAAILRSVAFSADGFVNRSIGLNGLSQPLSGLAPTPSDYRWVLFALVVAMLVLVYLVLVAVSASPWGRVLRAIRENEEAARASGKDTVRFRMEAFVLGGALMALAGAIWAHRNGTIEPNSFSDLFGTFIVWAMLIVGGSGNHRGAVLGALVVGLIWFGLPLIQQNLPAAIGSDIFPLREFVVGLLVVLFLLRLPRGIMPEEARVSRFAPVPPNEAGHPLVRLVHALRR
jgi:branched-chain amino acid transport system permease protein